MSDNFCSPKHSALISVMTFLTAYILSIVFWIVFFQFLLHLLPKDAGAVGSFLLFAVFIGELFIISIWSIVAAIRAGLKKEITDSLLISSGTLLGLLSLLVSFFFA